MMARRTRSAPESEPRVSGIVVPFGVAADDASLVTALREDRPGAKAAFFQSYAPYVERLVTHLIGFDRELADIIQDVFLNALGSLQALEDPRALKPWLARVTANTTLKVLRSRSRRAWLRLFRDSDDELNRVEPAPDLDQDVLRALRGVYDVLRHLPAEESVAFALRYVEGMDLAEVASACGVSLATIKRRMARAETRFVTAARKRPELAEWLKGGTRWRNR